MKNGEIKHVVLNLTCLFKLLVKDTASHICTASSESTILESSQGMANVKTLMSLRVLSYYGLFTYAEWSLPSLLFRTIHFRVSGYYLLLPNFMEIPVFYANSVVVSFWRKNVHNIG